MQAKPFQLGTQFGKVDLSRTEAGTMALPALATLEECADFSKTVTPFLPQLYALPANILNAVANRGSFFDLYTQTNPLITGFGLSLAFGAVFLVVAEINRNYSQVDRCWSLLPTFYVAHFNVWARLLGLPTKRLDTILLFSTLWSVSGIRGGVVVATCCSCYMRLGSCA